MAKCILDLIAYNEEHPAIWGVNMIQDVWEELKSSFRMELVHFDTQVIAYCQGDRSPTLEKVKFICGVIKEDGFPLLVPSDAFDLTSPSAYF